MAKQISVAQARSNLRESAKGLSLRSSDISLCEAKDNLRRIDEELDLAPIVPALDQGRYKDALILSLTWSVSTQGLKTLSPLLTRLISIKTFK